MASLLDLSNELIYKVCLSADCEDLKPFSATSRRIYHVSKPIMDKYRPLWSKFERLSDEPLSSPWFWHNLTLSLISGSPGAPFIRHIKTGFLSQIALAHRTPHTTMKDWDLETDSETMIPFQRKRVGLPRLTPNGSLPGRSFDRFEGLDDAVEGQCGYMTESQRRDLRHGIKRGEEGYIRPLLLPLLPNLRSLKIRAYANKFHLPLELAVRDAAIAHSLHRPCLAFRELTSVDLTGHGVESPNFGDVRNLYTWDLLAALMALPKMRNIAASLMRVENWTRPRDLPASNVTEIRFLEADFPPKVYENLWKDGAPVASLCLRIRGTPLDFDVGRFGDVLLQNARNSLRSLEILSDFVGGAANGISLQHFTQLQELTIGWEFLHLDSSISMLDVLPHSLRKFTIHAMRYTEEVPEQLLHLLMLKEDRFPNWEELRVDSWLERKDTMALTEACREHGVVWVSSERHELDSKVGTAKTASGVPRLVLPRR